MSAPTPARTPTAPPPRPSATAQIDHFNWSPPLGDAGAVSFKQRYYVYDNEWNRSAGPIFFYFGNEDDVGVRPLAVRALRGR